MLYWFSTCTQLVFLLRLTLWTRSLFSSDLWRCYNCLVYWYQSISSITPPFWQFWYYKVEQYKDSLCHLYRLPLLSCYCMPVHVLKYKFFGGDVKAFHIAMGSVFTCRSNWQQNVKKLHSILEPVSSASKWIIF